jgi:cytoskeletal protein RodZ
MPGSEVQELGQLLREARERKGVTLADAQQATKIRLSFLQALEKEDFSVLPPPFYIRGFIKTYAVYLNIDPRNTVQLFDEMLENVHSSRLVEQQTLPSADSGGQTALIPLEGLSQGEAELVANSNERLNLQALPPPNPPHLVSGQRRSTGFTQSFEDNSGGGAGRGGLFIP